MAWARVLGVGDMVVARRERIRVTLFGHQTRRSPISPCHGRIASSTTISAIIAAGQEIVGRDADVGADLEGAISVRHRLHRSESPARTTGRLVTDLSNSRAVRPVGASVERVRKSGKSAKSLVRKRFTTFFDTHQSGNFIASHSRNKAALVSAGSPCGAKAVDVVHHVFVDNGFNVSWHGANQSQSGGKDQKSNASHCERNKKAANR